MPPGESVKKPSSGKKKGGKRKIPILSQDRMPMHELSRLPVAMDEDYDVASSMDEAGPTLIAATASTTAAAQASKKKKSESGSEKMKKKKASSTTLTGGKGEGGKLSKKESAKAAIMKAAEEASLLHLESIKAASTGSGSEKKKEELKAEEDESEEELHWDDQEESIRARIDVSREKMKNVMESLSEEQLRRYETFRRSGLQRPVVKKWVQGYTSQTIHPNVAILTAGVAKVYVGELVETACSVRDEWGDSGPLLPSHIKEGYRRLDASVGNLSAATRSFSFVSRKRII